MKDKKYEPGHNVMRTFPNSEVSEDFNTMLLGVYGVSDGEDCAIPNYCRVNFNFKKEYKTKEEGRK